MIIGGEPFTHPGLAEFLSEQSFNIYIIVYTNFAVPLQKYQWPDNIHFITSWDAPDDETYRRIRRTKHFPLVMKNINQNRDRIIHVDTTVSRLNIMKLDRILEMTEEIGCTHWFLPIDPRVLRYAKKHKNDPLAKIVAKKVKEILLDYSDLKIIKDFFNRHKNNPRINDYSMFKGLYLAGIRHFEDLPEYSYSNEIIPSNIDTPSIEHCPAVENYLEITFNRSGKFIPVIHCPLLKRIYPEHRVPQFDNFDDLIKWVSSIRAQIKCSTFCGRTQFLGLDSYKDVFSKVKYYNED